MNQIRVVWVGLIAVWLGGCVHVRSSRHGPPTAVGGLVVMPWEIQPEKQKMMNEAGHGIGSLRKCGFDTVAFVAPEQVAACAKAGMRAFVGRPGGRVNWREMSDAAIDDYVKSVVDAAGRSETVLGYFLADEPNVRDFPALGKAVAAVKKYAPGKLAYINLYPNYATLGAPDLSQLGTASYTEYLERFVAEVKPPFISYDNYQVQFSADLAKRDVAAKYFTNLLEVRRVAQKHGLPFWVINNSNQIRPHTTVPSPANLLVQAYATLAAGARGLTWYTYYGARYAYGPVDQNGNRTVTWSYLRMVNEQVRVLAPIMSRLRSTGVYFTKPAPFDDAPPLPGKIVASVESPTAVMVGEFGGDGDEKYVMVVNLSLEKSAKLMVKLRSGNAEVISSVDGSATPQAAEGLWLAAGQGMLLRVR